MENYLDLLLECYRGGLHCHYYNENKVRELMFIFRAFYPKEQLRKFFSPALTGDTSFSQFIMDNYNSYNTLSDMASSLNYTVSGFEKKFRKIFGCSPYNWLKRRKALDIYQCISTSNLRMNEISNNFGFSSPAAFNTFVKQTFGITPGQIRQNKKKAV